MNSLGCISEMTSFCFSNSLSFRQASYYVQKRGSGTGASFKEQLREVYPNTRRFAAFERSFTLENLQPNEVKWQIFSFYLPFLCFGFQLFIVLVLGMSSLANSTLFVASAISNK